MHHSRPSPLLWVGLALAAGPLAVAAADPPAGLPAGADKVIAEKLAVQTAMLQGRDHLRQGQPARAVAVLEAQLARIDGSRAYLLTLRDAYQAHVTDLFLRKQDGDARKYLERLRILDPAAAAALEARPTTLAAAARPAAAPASPPQVAEQRRPAEVPRYVSPLRPPATAQAAGQTKIRGVMADAPAADPFAREHELPRLEAGAGRAQAEGLLARARDDFSHGRYGEARAQLEQARGAGALPAEGANQLAYCKLQHAFDELQKGAAPSPDLEREVREALTLSTAPRLTSFGESLLARMGRGGAAVRHYADGRSGLQVCESAHFRVFHRQSAAYAEQVARIAEQTRLAMSRKWLGNDGEDWQPRCDIFLHATRADYLGAEAVALDSPGHSRIENDQATGRVVSRRIHLRCDSPGVLEAVLPHETTHVVIAGLFSGRAVPRWVDEGIAVLAEPEAKVRQHRRNLAQAGQPRFPLRELVQMDQYPQPARVTMFYAQSVSLVDFLSRQKGPQEFCRFVRDGQREGWEAALRRHYGYRDFAELEARWGADALSGPALAER